MKVTLIYLLAYAPLVSLGVYLNIWLQVSPTYSNNLFLVVIAAFVAMKYARLEKGLNLPKTALSLVAGLSYTCASAAILKIGVGTLPTTFELLTAFALSVSVVLVMAKFRLL